MSKKIKIISKTPHHSGFQGWDIKTSDGREWSVLNFADSMKAHPFPSGAYLGWEALSDDGKIIRADTEQEILSSFS